MFICVGRGMGGFLKLAIRSASLSTAAESVRLNTESSRVAGMSISDDGWAPPAEDVNGVLPPSRRLLTSSSTPSHMEGGRICPCRFLYNPHAAWSAQTTFKFLQISGLTIADGNHIPIVQGHLTPNITLDTTTIITFRDGLAVGIRPREPRFLGRSKTAFFLPLSLHLGHERVSSHLTNLVQEQWTGNQSFRLFFRQKVRVIVDVSWDLEWEVSMYDRCRVSFSLSGSGSGTVFGRVCVDRR